MGQRKQAIFDNLQLIFFMDHPKYKPEHNLQGCHVLLGYRNAGLIELENIYR